MALIFAFSHDAASGQHSGWFVEGLAGGWLSLTGSPADPAVLDAIHLGLRKLAHMFEFGVLYLLVRRAGPGRIGALLFTIVYAGLDEWHQSFVTSRVGNPVDVAVDGVGAAAVACWEFFGRVEASSVEPGKVMPDRRHGIAGPG